jgi:hypothetical protein
MTDAPGRWFADPSDDYPDMWQAFIQVPGACHVLDGVWFVSERDCWQFIGAYLVGATASERR